MNLKGRAVGYLSFRFPKTWQRIQMVRRPWQYEPELFILGPFCGDGALAVDVGGHDGIFAREMLRHGAEVVVCEPNSKLMQRLHHTVRGKVRFIPKALSDKNGTAEFRFSDLHTGNSTIEEKNVLNSISAREQIQSVVVQTATLDSLGLEKVSFIKIDVEGHEEAVLHGASATIARDGPVILIETEHRHNQGAPDRVFEFASSRDYSTFFLRDGKLNELADLSANEIGIETARAAGVSYINNFIFVPNARPDYLKTLSEAVKKMPQSFRRPRASA